MTIHNLRDYSPATKTAANRVYPPDAPIVIDAVPEEWLDAAFARVTEPADFVEAASGAILLVVVGVVFAVMLAVAVL